jgi:DNA polymerase III, gamma/tau subunit dnaX
MTDTKSVDSKKMSDDSKSDRQIELYKKYRPQVWSDLIGQQDVARTFQNAISWGREFSAYGLFGPRGCGKTSAAFIFAKAVNCLDPQPDANPCNKCDVCRNIDDNNQFGVDYISMANKGYKEDVLEIMKQSRMKADINRRVIILDEVHNLSKSAFDSILIPVESKDMNATVMFCSTESDRIPDTISSRIQSRKFSLVPGDIMTEHMKHILELEGETVRSDILRAVVRRGRGSVRDTLTVLDEVLVSGGIVSTDVGSDIIESLADLSVPDALDAVMRGVSEGQDGRVIAEGLFSSIRDLILIGSGVTEIIPPVENEKQVIKKLHNLKGMFAIQEEIGDAINRMSIGTDSRILLEIALIKAFKSLKEIRASASSKKQSSSGNNSTSTSQKNSDSYTSTSSGSGRRRVMRD